MKAQELKVVSIGNSRGVRLPATLLRRYHIGNVVLMECGADAIVLRPVGPAVEKLSWAETACEMAKDTEDWSAWDAVAADGLDSVPWGRKTLAVAEDAASYGVAQPTKPRARSRTKPS